MARFYSKKDMLDILKSLDIRPVNGTINTQETARVLTWRVKEEYGREYTYTDVSVRSRVYSGSLTPVGGKQKNSRYNTYKIEDVFTLPLFPGRAEGVRKYQEEKKLADSETHTSNY